VRARPTCLVAQPLPSTWGCRPSKRVQAAVTPTGLISFSRPWVRPGNVVYVPMFGPSPAPWPTAPKLLTPAGRSRRPGELAAENRQDRPGPKYKLVSYPDRESP